jgi:hypothetical protein
MKRTKINLSNYKLATMDMGQLVPVQCQEVLPGDTFRMQTSALVRLSPMMAPVMHPVTVRLHHWFVPNRLLWDGWEDFITGGPDGQDASTPPTLTVASGANSIPDYMGVPPVDGVEFNAMPIRAYNMIFNEFYRDQDLQTEVDLDTMTLQNVSWRKDYFTAARPFQQKGPDLVLPIGDSAPLRNVGGDVSQEQQNFSWDAEAKLHASSLAAQTADSELYADLSEATGVSATDFREFFALQRYAEARARYGSRYTEYLRYLGVTPSDARLQRPEYLGGGKTNIQFSEVLTTYDNDASSDPAGTMRGHGISAIKTKGTRRFFEEHGYVITLMSVVPKSIYQDGMHKMWTRHDKEDFFQKELQSIGQQPVYTSEVYAQGTAEDDNVFGYQDRYSEYTSTPSTVSAEFRDTLDHWHLARKFTATPVLNESFIQCNPSKRIFAEQTQHSLWCMINNNVVSRRQVKRESVGRLM